MSCFFFAITVVCYFKMLLKQRAEKCHIFDYIRVFCADEI